MKKRNLIGTNLKNIRRHNNLSQEQLIAQLNLLGLDLDRTSLSRIENHNREVYGVWNLVLSCNRCENGKFAKLHDPESYLQKLYDSN